MGKRGHGEGTIRQRKDGLWEAAYSYWAPNGALKRRSVYGKTQRVVSERLRAALRVVDQGATPITERQTVAQFLDRWLLDVAKPTVRASTYVSYRHKTQRYLTPALGRHQLAKLTPQHVQAMLNEMGERGLAPRTILTTRAILRKALNQALKWGLVSRNVATLVDPPRIERYEITTLDPEQARRFLDAVRDDRLQALYAVALALGLRQGEALGLRWRDIDLDAGTLQVCVALQHVRGAPARLVEPKTRQSRRTLPLPAPIALQLRAHRTRQLRDRLLAGERWHGEEWGLVFTNSFGGPLATRTLHTQFKANLSRAGLPNIRFHDLRHSCASLLVAQGVHPRVVMEILGHSTIALTMNTYAHVLPQAQREAIGLLDSLFGTA